MDPENIGTVVIIIHQKVTLLNGIEKLTTNTTIQLIEFCAIPPLTHICYT